MGNAAAPDGSLQRTARHVPIVLLASTVEQRATRRSSGAASTWLPRRLVTGGVLLCLTATPLRAQSPPPAPADTLRPLAVGFGVDTSAVSPFWGDGPWRAPLPEIYRAWRAYLSWRHAPATRAAADSGKRLSSPLWSAEEQARWPDYDLAGFLAYQGFQATVLDIRPARPVRLDATVDTFVVKTLFTQVATVRGRTEVKPVVLTRVLARREGDRWVFANVLESLTRDWPRHGVGPITYVVDPAHRFDRARAERAVRFADSLATAFGVPRLQRLDYYVTDEPDAMYRLFGIDWTITPDPHGAGQAGHRNRQIFVGAPSLGEAYLHEIAHTVLAPLTPAGTPGHPMLAEGLATWVGGSLGFGPAELRAEYARWLHAHPAVTLDTVLVAEGGDYGWRPGAAVLFELVHARGGLPAVRTLLGAGPRNEDLRSTAERATGLPWEQIVERWRRLAMRPPVAPTASS